MKNTYIAIIALVLIGSGFWFFMSNNNKASVPVTVDNTQTDNTNTRGVGLEEKPLVNIVNTSVTVQNTPVKEFIISGQNFSFTPNMITVKKGDRVKIIFNNTLGFHNLRIDEFGIASEQSKSPSQEVLEFTADKIGSFQYYCSVGSHRSMGMFGTLKVE